MTEALFDKSAEYDAMLALGLQLSGESKDYFARGRISDLMGQLPANFSPKRILDFGCGMGDTTKLLSEQFPHATVIGVDTAANAIQFANKKHASEKIRFVVLKEMAERDSIDFCYTNGVFHHIAPHDRLEVMSMIYQSLAPGGTLAFFENNPWNLGTRLVMRRIPFDQNAIPLSPHVAKALLKKSGYEIVENCRTLFYFPKRLKFLRFLEPSLAKLPLGAQYYYLVKK